MTTTPNLALPYLEAAQAQKHVTHNEAIRALDAIVQLGVLDRDLTAPPGSPGDGDRYIVAAGATGSWAGKDGQIAAYQDSSWMFHIPQEGWLAWVADEDQLYVWEGSAWAQVSDSDLQNISLLGVNATADTTNRLAVSSPESLFNHEGAGHLQKINKALTTDTASQLFQTNFSGRAEHGLIADDDYRIRVSPNGSAWFTGLQFDKGSGNAAFNGAAPSGGIAARFAGNIFEFKTTSGSFTQFNIINDGAYVAATFKNYSDTSWQGDFFFTQRARGTLASPAAVVTGDSILTFANDGYDGTAFVRSSQLIFKADGTIATGIVPGRAQIQLMDNAGVTTTRFDQRQDGALAITGKTTITGDLISTGVMQPGSFTIATLPTGKAAGSIIYVSDMAGQAEGAFYDGTNWRRTSDLTVAS